MTEAAPPAKENDTDIAAPGDAALKQYTETYRLNEAQTPERRRPWRYTRVGAVVLSYDCYLGVPIGVLAAVSAIFSPDVRSALPGVLIGVAGVGAAVATLVLTSLAVLLGTITPAYRRMLTQVPGGVIGTARPFRWVVGLSATATAWSLLAAGLIPLVKDNGWAAFGLTAPAFALLLWAVFGCVQVTGQLVHHWEQRERAETLEERRQKALHRSA